jgi:hypothetical protein
MPIQIPRWSVFGLGRRDQAGQQFVELSAGIVVIVIIVLAFMDMSTLLTAAALNSSLARDAARAASTGPPGDLEPGKDRVVDEHKAPYQRAYAAVIKGKPNSPSVELAPEIHVVETVESPVPAEPYGGPVSGTVSVATTMLVHPRFLLLLVHMPTLSLTACESFPYTWVMKSSLVPVPKQESNYNSDSSNYSTGSYSSGSYASSGSYSSGSYFSGNAPK